MITLREDQEDVRTKLRVALRSSSAVLVFAPTGFGKTVLAAALIKLIFDAGKTIIFCVHRVDLIVQTAKTFERFGIPFSYIAAGMHYNPYHRVFIASIASLKNRMHNIPADYVMVDEAHLSAAAGWAAVAKHYKERKAKLIGLTGSPERLDGKPLGDVWDQMVMGPSVRWLIENGHLSRYRAFAPAGLDLTGFKVRDNEYVGDGIDKLLAGKAQLSGAVRHWKKYCSGLRTIGFTRRVEGAELLAAEFRANGVNAVALDGNTPLDVRRAAFVGFADRKIEVILNCALFCEGFDLAAQVDRDVTIEAVLQYAPTQSLAKHLQQLGRGLRKKDYPAILLDLVGNLARLGLPDEDREWSLEGRKKKDRETSSVICPKCFASHMPAPKCEECGYRYPVKEREGAGGGPKIEEIDGEVKEVDVDAVRREREKQREQAAREIAFAVKDGKKPNIPEDQEKRLKELIKLATAKGYKKPEHWAAHVLTAKMSGAAR